MSGSDHGAVERVRDALNRTAPRFQGIKISDLEAILSRIASLEGALTNTEAWLTAALECKLWSWDADQYESASMSRDQARSLLPNVDSEEG